jgi:hypothetical protein
MTQERFVSLSGADVLIIVMLAWTLYLVYGLAHPKKPKAKTEQFDPKPKKPLITPIKEAVPDFPQYAAASEIPPMNEGSFKLLDNSMTAGGLISAMPYMNYDMVTPNNTMNFSSEGRGWSGSPAIRRQLSNGADINDFVRD